MAIKAKPKRRAQSNHSRGAFPRRLTWREVESAFNHMFEHGVETTEATRLIHRFKRARSQLLPIFSVMVVSPYERERTLANDLLGKIGGRTTLTMVESVLADIDIYEPFKLELRRLAEKLALDTAHLPDDEDDDDGDGERPVRAKADGEADGEAEGEGEERGRQPRGRAKRGRAGAARGKRGAPGEGEAAEVVTERPRPSRRRKLKPLSEGEAKQLFSRPGEAFLAALDDPIDRLVAGFWLIDPAKRVSFADRLVKVDEPRLVPFLTALLASDQRALVHSALKAIAALGHPSALEGVEALISRTQTKAVRQRAEEVRAQLLDPAARAPQSDAAESDEAEEAGDGRRRSRRSRPRPKNADVLGQPDVESDGEPGDDEGRGERTQPADAAGLGLVVRVAPPVELVNETPIEATARLPRLQNCLASGLGSDGTQWIWVYRAGSGGTLERLTLCVNDAGWQAAVLDQGLPGDADRADLAAAAEAGEQRVEVTMAYGRRRVQQAASINAERGLALPTCASAAMAWLGTGRRVEVEEEVDGETLITVESAQVLALLEHPLMAGWSVRVTPDGEATAQWLATRRRRSASRQRKLLIDDVVNAWLDEVGSATLAERLRLQAWLLRRANQDELADVATALAVQLLGDRATDNMLLREIVYRALGVALDEVRDLRHAERAERRDRPAPERTAAAPAVTDVIDVEAEDDEGDEPDESPARGERESRDGRRRDRRRRGGRNRRRGPGRAVAGKRLVATRCRRRRLAAQRVRQTTARRLTVSRALLARKNRAHRRRR